MKYESFLDLKSLVKKLSLEIKLDKNKLIKQFYLVHQQLHLIILKILKNVENILINLLKNI